uniref:Sperm associated antigen 8 n=1 Tax=Jaculus jaculus TaxID=51337 RepID=A0A8C5P0P5_JACJA
METRALKSLSLDIQSSSEELGTTSDDCPGSALEGTTKPAELYATTTEPLPSTDSLLEAAYPVSPQTDRGSLGFKPLCVSYIPRSPGIIADLPSGPGPGPGPARGSNPISSSDPDHGSLFSSGPVHKPVPGTSYGPGSSPAHGTGPGHGPNLASGADPGPELSSRIPQRYLRPDCPNYNPSCHNCQWEPQKQPWEPLQVPEPGARGPWKPTEVEEKSQFPWEALPRGHVLLNNWEEERATNHLDQIPSLQDGSESFFFRHGHQGLLTKQPQSPLSSSTTHKDSYQPPRNTCRPLRGKREAMLEMLLHHQICKEVQAEQEPPRKLFEVESVTHHDYRMELVQTGPPAPTKPHDYRQEQPETFWIQRASQLPGVSNIRTLDTPFRKNCSFSTPVPLSMGQPLPYEPDNFCNQMEEMSSLACQGGQQGGTTLA